MSAGCTDKELLYHYKEHVWFGATVSSSTNIYCNGKEIPLLLLSTGRNLRNTDKEFLFDTNVTGGREERRVNKPQQRIAEKFRQIQLINYVQEESTSTVVPKTGMYLSWYTVKIVYMVNGFVQYIYPNLSVLQYLIKYAENSSFPLKRDVFSARQEQILPKTISQLLQKICEEDVGRKHSRSRMKKGSSSQSLLS